MNLWLHQYLKKDKTQSIMEENKNLNELAILITD